MVVLLTGATGFLGSRLSQAMRLAGHEVVEVHRHPPNARDATGARYVHGDFTTYQDAADWVGRLRGVDVVVNAVGILRESKEQSFTAIHVDGPRALFEACVQAGVQRVVQVSALGADEDAPSAYHRSKRAADEHLLSLPLSAVVVQPSLLYGAGGASARLFSQLAVMPIVPVPGDGRQMVQPLHVDDGVSAILALLPAQAVRGRVPLVGPEALSLQDFLMALRHSLGLGPTWVFHVPASLVTAAAWCGSHVPGALLDLDTWHMLKRGNTGSGAATRMLLGGKPRPPAWFVRPEEAPAQRTVAQLSWLLPMLRVSLAVVWLVTAYVSLFVFPLGESLALLHRSGVPPLWAPVFLWGAGLLDLVFGVATLFAHRWRPLWLLQALLILFYTAVITLRLPEYWLHPYGPMLKNLPMLGVIWLLYTLAPHRTPKKETP